MKINCPRDIECDLSTTICKDCPYKKKGDAMKERKITECEKRFGQGRLYYVSDSETNEFIGNFCAGCMTKRAESHGNEKLAAYFREKQNYNPELSCSKKGK